MKQILIEFKRVEKLYNDQSQITEKSYKKYNLFSINDSAFTSMMMAAKVFDLYCLLNAFEINKNEQDFTENCEKYPMQASSLVFELVSLTQKNSQKKQIKLRFNYNGKYVDFCRLNNSYEDFLCDIGTFGKIVNRMIVTKPNNEYYIESDVHNNKIGNFAKLYQAILFIGLLVFLLIIQLLVQRRRKKTINEQFLRERICVDFGETD